jgi:GrpB-like predicted nucleotidyltransferase (UPF0157 family)
MLGLQRHIVVLQPYDPAWMAQAVEEIQRIANATGLPHARIQHVGSTSVPGLVAKPILDINIGLLDDEDPEVIVATLIRLGFIDRGDRGGGIGRLIVWEIAPEVRAVHVHIVPFDSIGWKQDLAFRDALRNDTELREAYAALKTQLASQHRSSRADYRHGKDPFIAAAVQRILADRSNLTDP